MRRGERAALAWFALFAGVVVSTVATRCADASRFGDSTWVAPGIPFDSDPATDGPRVAPRDHERAWETVLRAPFRVVFFPLRILARGLEAGAMYVGPHFGPKAKPAPKPGLSVAPYIHLGDWNDLGAGPDFTWGGFPTADAKLELAGAWSTIDRRRVRFRGISSRHQVGYQVRAAYDYRPNRAYYGIGNETPKTDLSRYLLESTNAEAALLVGASPLRQLRIVGGFSSMSPRRGYHATPLLEDVFGPASQPFEHRSTHEVVYGVSADLGALDDPRDPSLGAHGRVDLRRAAGLRASDPDYYQWSVEGRAYVPVFAKRRVLVVRGVYVGVKPTSGTTILPYYRLAQSTDPSRFAAYSSDRFRDRQLVLARIEYRWAIVQRLSAVALYELGEVAPFRRSFTLRDAHESYGGGVRLGTEDGTALRFELAKGDEGYAVILTLRGDF